MVSNLQTGYHDLSPTGLDATLVSFNNCATYAWQGSGSLADPYVLEFNAAVGDYISVPNISQWQSGTEFTIGIWFKSPGVTSGNGMILFDKRYPTNGSVVATGSNSSISFQALSSPGDVEAGSAAWSTTDTRDAWHYMTVTHQTTIAGYNAGYWDAELVYSDSYADELWNWNTQPMRIGSSADSWFQKYRGSIGAIHMYDRALSPEEIRKNCLATAWIYPGASCN